VPCDELFVSFFSFGRELGVFWAERRSEDSEGKVWWRQVDMRPRYVDSERRLGHRLFFIFASFLLSVRKMGLF